MNFQTRNIIIKHGKPEYNATTRRFGQRTWRKLREEVASERHDFFVSDGEEKSGGVWAGLRECWRE